MSQVAACCPIAAEGSQVPNAVDIGDPEALPITKTQTPACESQDAAVRDITTSANQSPTADEENDEKPVKEKLCTSTLVKTQVLETENSTPNAVGDAYTIEHLKVDNDLSITNQNLSEPAKLCEQSENPSATSNMNGRSDASKAMESTTNKNEANIKQMVAISKLEQEVQKRTQERDAYRKKLEETEKKLAALQTSYDSLMCGDSDEAKLRQMVEQLKSKLIQTSLQLDERGRVVANQENQINALNNQVTSLKEVVTITRELMIIRNTEVTHLQTEIDDMENRISEERTRHNTMLTKMEAAARLNADLKKEYETQLRLFQDLRGKYEEKVTLLSEEKQALETAAQSAAQ